MQGGINPKILFEDNRIVAVEKPQGFLAQADFTNRADIYTFVKNYIKEKYRKPGNVYLGIIHRLDKEVGGVMVFAKNSKTAAQLSEQIRERIFEKIYYAVLQNFSLSCSAKLEDYLVKDSKTNSVRTAEKQEIDAKQAVLDYELVEQKEGMSLVKIKLETGRTHQIRVQFASRGCPIFGDSKYGGTKAQENKIALWAKEVVFEHPVSKEKLTIISDPPKIFPWTLFSSLR